jgi:xanthine dehydrogenase iron-sulfur cluster and FAD-binding subunit A
MTIEQFDKATPIMERIQEVEKQIKMAENISSIQVGLCTPNFTMEKFNSLSNEFEPVADAIRTALKNKLNRLKKDLEKI